MHSDPPNAKWRNCTTEFPVRRKKAPPARRGRSQGRNFAKLEAELDGQLNAAWTSAAEERVADAYIAGGGDLITTVADFTGPRGVRLESASAGTEVRRWISNEGRQQRT